MASGVGRKAIWAVGIATLLLTAGGCVTVSNDGDAQVFHYEAWVPISVLLLGLAAAPAGWFFREHSERLAWGLMALGPIAALGFAPSLFCEKTRVDDKGFHVSTGIWGMTTHDVTFADVHQIRVTAEVSTSRRGGKKTNYYLNFDKRSGGSAKVPINNDVAEKAAEAIVGQAAQHNINIVDATGGK